jgi:hypothetical protein
MTFYLRKFCLLCLLLVSAGLSAQFYQGSNMEFGKNRIQYRDFTWFYYPGEHFEVYYYIGGEPLAQYVLMSAEENLVEMQHFFDFSLDDKIQVLSYINQSEFRQSNIGLTGDEQFNIGGSARILGNKMFTYYEGTHEKLDKQIRENISRVLFSQLMYGGDWKDVLKSSTLLSVPKWYEEGIIAYAANGVTSESETYVKDLVGKNKFKSFNYLEGRDARLAGQAFWNFIGEVYGQNVIPNILYMAQASRNVDSGFLYVLGLSLEQLSDEFVKFYKDKAAAGRQEVIPSDAAAPEDRRSKEYKAWKKSQRMLGDVKVKYKKEYLYSQFKFSPDGKYMAYVTNELGQYRIWLYDTTTGKKKCILKKDHRLDRIIDESFPVLAWHPSSGILTYIFEKNANAWLGNYNLEEKKHTQKELFLIEKVIDMSYSDDGKRIVMSGVNRGQTDLYLYQVIGNNQEQLTFDPWDDMHPRFIDGNRRIIFSSNRPDDTLRKEVPLGMYPHDKDIYIFNVENRGRLLERITATEGADEDYASEYTEKHYTFIGNNLGHYNRYLATVDSAISSIDTTIHYRYFTVSTRLSSYQRDIHDYQFNHTTGDYLTVFRKMGQPWVHLGNRSLDNALSQEQPESQGEYVSQEEMEARGLRLSTDSITEGEVDIDNYIFEDERKDYTYEKESVRVQEVGKETTAAAADSVRQFVLPRSRNYRLNFAADYVVAQVSGPGQQQLLEYFLPERGKSQQHHAWSFGHDEVRCKRPF